MKENSIEEITFVENEIKNTRRLFEEVGCYVFFDEDLCKSIEHILSDYKRVLNENEELKIKNNAIKRESEAYAEDMIRLDIKKQDYFEKYRYHLQQNESLTKEFSNVIPIQKVKDIIDRIDYDIKKTKEIISKNTNIYASYQKNDYQIVRLRAMNTKSLDIKKRLQELLESEE